MNRLTRAGRLLSATIRAGTHGTCNRFCCRESEFTCSINIKDGKEVDRGVFKDLEVPFKL